LSHHSKLAGQDLALERFREIERQLPRLLDALIASSGYQRGRKPAAPNVAGVYLFTEEGVHRYVGRTRNANRRLGEHTQPKSPQNSSPFAFNIAKAEAIRGGFDITGTRKQLAETQGFAPYFTSAKERVRSMEFRVVEIVDPAVSTIFEVYASIALGTEGEFNLFDTH
jgi:hypothetical protein